MSRTKQVRVSRVAEWAGWCSPCESEGRPLVLTRTGPAGPGAWLAGIGDDDRFLLLTCNVCGHWQVVPPHEDDDPEVVLEEDEAVRAAVHEMLADARAEQAVAPVVVVPVPRAEAPVELPFQALVDPAASADAHVVVLDLTAAAPSLDMQVVAADPHLEIPPCAVVPTPRRATALPATTPAFSPEAVAAAAAVLAAARGQTQRTAPRSATPRPAPLDRSRRTRSTASSRRTERPAPARGVRPAVATSIALPVTSSSQLLLAAAG